MKDMDIKQLKEVDKYNRNTKDYVDEDVNIYAKTLTGKVIVLNCLLSSSVYDLKLKIYGQEGIPTDQQRLIFAGKQLEEDRSLREYHIFNKSTVHLVLRLRGGSPNPDPALPGQTNINQHHQQQEKVRSEQCNTYIERPVSSADRDITTIPNTLDKNFENFCDGDSVRATIIHIGNNWDKCQYKSIVSSSPDISSLQSSEIEDEKKKAFDLLNALTKSGALTIDSASLHVVIVATHVFDKTIVDTIVEDNCNPIDHIERTTAVMAQVVHQIDTIGDLVKADKQLLLPLKKRKINLK